MQKRGQFYLVAAIVLVTLILGFSTIANYSKKNQNLRDHMTDWELIFTMVGEKATTDIK